jgi:hypothetical protein
MEWRTWLVLNTFTAPSQHWSYVHCRILFYQSIVRINSNSNTAFSRDRIWLALTLEKIQLFRLVNITYCFEISQSSDLDKIALARMRRNLTQKTQEKQLLWDRKISINSRVSWPTWQLFHQENLIKSYARCILTLKLHCALLYCFTQWVKFIFTKFGLV